MYKNIHTFPILKKILLRNCLVNIPFSYLKHNLRYWFESNYTLMLGLLTIVLISTPCSRQLSLPTASAPVEDSVSCHAAKRSCPGSLKREGGVAILYVWMG